MTATIGGNSVTSTDIGVAESSTTPVGQSLQLIGTGNKYSDFTWSGPIASTSGAVNANQTFNSASIPTPALLPGLVGLGSGVLRKPKSEVA
jgi:hypothetical protein